MSLIPRRSQAKNLLGHMAYILEGVKRLNLFQSWHARVRAAGFCMEDDFWYGSFTNTRSVGGFGFPNADKVQLDDGEFEVMLVRSPKSLAELNTLAARLVRQEFDGRDLVFLHAKELQVTFGAPVPWTLDGRVRRRSAAGAAFGAARRTGAFWARQEEK